MATAIDVSNFTGPIEVGDGPALRDEGRLLIANTHDPAIARQQTQLALGNCMAVELYAQQYLSVDAAREMAKADQVAIATPIVKVWLAWEENFDQDPDAGGYGFSPSKDVVLGWIYRTSFLWQQAGWQVGFYTRKGWWERWTGNDPFFGEQGIELWDADYDGVPDLGDFAQYGGWTSRKMKQYQDDHMLLGKYRVDLNVL